MTTRIRPESTELGNGVPNTEDFAMEMPKVPNTEDLGANTANDSKGILCSNGVNPIRNYLKNKYNELTDDLNAYKYAEGLPREVVKTVRSALGFILRVTSTKKRNSKTQR